MHVNCLFIFLGIFGDKFETKSTLNPVKPDIFSLLSKIFKIAKYLPKKKKKKSLQNIRYIIIFEEYGGKTPFCSEAPKKKKKKMQFGAAADIYME